MTLGEKIQLYRKKAGMSQAQLADALEVSRQSVSKWESDAAMPETEKIMALSLLFGVSTDRLLFDEDADGPEQAGSLPEPLPDPDLSESGPEAPENDAGDPDGSDGPDDGKRNKKRLIIIILLCVAGLCVLIFAGILVSHLVSDARESRGQSPARSDAAETAAGRERTPAATDVTGPTEVLDRSYPYILVHGLGGWGDGAGVNSITKYWGADSCDLAEYLTTRGYEVCAPTVGPVSSAWDRACELYAQLAGGTVDYGKAHSEAHHHARFGRTYAQPLVVGWGQPGGHARVNLVGHSFGGATVRLLASLLAYGDAEETAVGGDDISPLFIGGKAGLVNSVTALCAPHNGSSLTCILDDLGGVVGCHNTTELIASLCFACEGIAAPVKGVYDLMLDQFDIGPVTGGLPEIVNALSTVTRSEDDHAGWDLSPAGAAELNRKIRTVDGILYLSYAYTTTQRGMFVSAQVPTPSTFAVLYPFALAMGAYNGRVDGGVTVDESWQENDGLVSVVSAQYPFTEAHTDFTPGAVPARGIWNVMPVRKGHHGTAIGLGTGKRDTEAFYDELFALIEAVP